MNLMLLIDSDFTDSTRTHARLSGHRRDHALCLGELRSGDVLRVGAVNGKIGKAAVRDISREQLDLEVSLDEQPAPALPLTLVLALPRPKALKRCIESVSAMGVKNIFIIQSWRVEKSYWTSQVLSGATLRDHALLGLEQSGCDTVLPRIETRRYFKPFAEDELPEIARGTSSFVAHPAGEKKCPCAVGGPVTLMVGPEGGFIPFEIELLQKLGFDAVSLGRRMLRVEYAVPSLIGRLINV